MLFALGDLPVKRPFKFRLIERSEPSTITDIPFLSFCLRWWTSCCIVGHCRFIVTMHRDSTRCLSC